MKAKAGCPSPQDPGEQAPSSGPGTAPPRRLASHPVGAENEIDNDQFAGSGKVFFKRGEKPPTATSVRTYGGPTGFGLYVTPDFSESSLGSLFPNVLTDSGSDIENKDVSHEQTRRCRGDETLGVSRVHRRNEKGQLGHGDTKRVEAPRLIEGLSHEVIVSAACGRNHTLALTETGSVFAFGENKMGQLGLGNQTDAVPSPAQIMYNGQPITKMACGAEFSMIMDCKGNLYSFGCPEYGQLGHNSDGKFIARAQRIEYDCELVPRRVAIFIEKTKDGQILPVPNVVVRDVACGANHTLVLDSQKRVFSWGFGGYGRLGHAEQKDEMVPRLVKLFDFPGRGASQIYAGYTCSFAVSEVGGLFFWGATNTSRESTMYPKAVQDLCGWRIRSLACGKSSIIVAADESTISWGPSPTFGELGYGDHKPKSSTAAQEVKTLDGIFTEQVAMGYSHSLVIARDESETEKEKIKKLPEYNPRTL
ncbi:hypothetical protein E2I00_013701 [Balaenoptera physalus]|uniref:RCC1-like domain-containing protein n=1 Tax=Balaenoptera physalus TaxID=9770 RepID=A0A6A1Q7J2_BALPH|nr:hypothetical protein E2I00_013701 [Balaenoptera physalus]